MGHVQKFNQIGPMSQQKQKGREGASEGNELDLFTSRQSSLDKCELKVEM